MTRIDKAWMSGAAGLSLLALNLAIKLDLKHCFPWALAVVLLFAAAYHTLLIVIAERPTKHLNNDLPAPDEYGLDQLDAFSTHQLSADQLDALDPDWRNKIQG